VPRIASLGFRRYRRGPESPVRFFTGLWSLLCQSRLIRSGVLLALIAPPSRSTLILLEWHPDRIVLLADSLQGEFLNNQVTITSVCKIHQEGDLFFAIGGIEKGRTINIDLIPIAMKAAKTKGRLENVLSAFEVAADQPIKSLWRDAVKNPVTVASLQGNVSSIVFASRREQATAIVEYAGRTDGSVTEKPRQVFGTGQGREEYTMPLKIGTDDAAQRAMASDPFASRLTGINFLLNFMEKQLAFEAERQRRHEFPRVGRPITVLQIGGGRASWMDGYQGLCSAIKP
jgi:hypothetical protein